MRSPYPNLFLKSLWIGLFIFFGIFPLQAQSYFTNGTAKSVGGDCYRLTSAQNNQNGSVWYSDQIDLNKPFDLEFNLNLGSKDGGADGIVFVIHTAGTDALGSSGGGIGFEGFSPSLGVEFDTWQNSEYGDPSADHLAVVKNGSVNHTTSNSIVSPISALSGGGNIEDGKNHPVRITWDPATKRFEVYFECQKRISATIDLIKTIFPDNQLVYWGFTSATGGANNVQTACLRKDIIQNATYEICKGQTVTLNARESFDNTYSWTPSAGLNDPTIRNPTCSITSDQRYIVEFKDVCGNSIRDTVDVFVSDPFSISLGNDTLLCNGDYLSFDFRNNYDRVVWENGSRSFTRNLSSAGIYSITAWRGSCNATNNLIVETSETPKIEIIGIPNFCQGDSTLLSVNITPEGQSFFWENGSNQPTRYISEIGQVQVSASNDCGSSEVSLDITSTQIPIIDLGPDTTICAGTEFSLILEPLPGDSIVWENGTDDAIRVIGSAGKYAVSIFRKGCINVGEIQVDEISAPTIDLPEDLILCHKQRRVINSGAKDAITIWNDQQTKDDYELYEFEGLIKIYSENKCGKDSHYLNVILEECFCDVYLPNAVTPNFDGLNEGFGPTVFCQYLEEYRLIVFNRWGEVVFESLNPENFWDLRMNDQYVQAGVYFYIQWHAGMVGGSIKKHQQSGTLHVLR